VDGVWRGTVWGGEDVVRSMVGYGGGYGAGSTVRGHGAGV
jgi:hypothetical protein